MVSKIELDLDFENTFNIRKIINFEESVKFWKEQADTGKSFCEYLLSLLSPEEAERATILFFKKIEKE